MKYTCLYHTRAGFRWFRNLIMSPSSGLLLRQDQTLAGIGYNWSVCGFLVCWIDCIFLFCIGFLGCWTTYEAEFLIKTMSDSNSQRTQGEGWKKDFASNDMYKRTIFGASHDFHDERSNIQSFFVTNFPESVLTNDMWRMCARLVMRANSYT